MRTIITSGGNAMFENQITHFNTGAICSEMGKELLRLGHDVDFISAEHTLCSLDFVTNLQESILLDREKEDGSALAFANWKKFAEKHFRQYSVKRFRDVGEYERIVCRYLRADTEYLKNVIIVGAAISETIEPSVEVINQIRSRNDIIAAGFSLSMNGFPTAEEIQQRRKNNHYKLLVAYDAKSLRDNRCLFVTESGVQEFIQQPRQGMCCDFGNFGEVFVKALLE